MKNNLLTGILTLVLAACAKPPSLDGPLSRGQVEAVLQCRSSLGSFIGWQATLDSYAEHQNSAWNDLTQHYRLPFSVRLTEPVSRTVVETDELAVQERGLFAVLDMNRYPKLAEKVARAERDTLTQSFTKKNRKKAQTATTPLGRYRYVYEPDPAGTNPKQMVRVRRYQGFWNVADNEGNGFEDKKFLGCVYLPS